MNGESKHNCISVMAFVHNMSLQRLNAVIGEAFSELVESRVCDVMWVKDL